MIHLKPWLRMPLTAGFALLLSLHLFANAPSDPAWPHETSDLEPDPALVLGRLENGLRYVLLPNQEPRERASFRLIVGVGSLHEREGEEGIAHYLEHMAFNGTRNFAPEEMVRYFQNLGMAFGADTNAFTGFDRTGYIIDLPKADPSSVGEALLVFHDWADGMLLLEEEVEKERGVILAEERARDSIDFRTTKKEFSFLLPESLIPQRFPIGFVPSIEAFGRKDFVDFYNTWYRPENMTIIIVGEMDVEDTRSQIHARFASFAPRAPARNPPDRGQVLIPEETIAMAHQEPQAGSVRVSIHTLLGVPPQEDSIGRRLDSLRRNALLAILNQRLEERSKEEGAPFTQAILRHSELFGEVEYSTLILITNAGQWEETLAEGENFLRQIAQYGLQQSELEQVRADLLAALERSVRAAPTRNSRALASAISDAVVADRVFLHPDQFLAMARPALESLQLEDLEGDFRRLWPERPRHLFVTGNLPTEPSPESIAAIYRQASQVEVAPPVERITSEFGYTDFGPAGEVVHYEHIEDLDLHLVRFANGVRVNLKQTDFASNSILFSARVGHGLLSLEPAEAAKAMFADVAFVQGGLGLHSIEDLRRILAGTTVGLSFSTSQDAFVLRGSSTPDDLERQLQFLCAHLVDPGWRSDALPRLRNQIRQYYQRLAFQPEGVLQGEVARLLADGDPRFGLPPEEALLQLTMEDLRNWLGNEFKNGSIELALAGDFDIDTVLPLLARTLGALPPRQETEAPQERLNVRFPDDPPRSDFRVQTVIPTGFSALYWPTTDAFDIRKTRRMSVLAQVFSDRLREAVREELGEVYSIWASHQPSEVFPGYGFMSVVTPVAPEVMQSVETATLKVAGVLSEGGITEEELQRALEPILASLRDSLRQNSYWLNAVLMRAQSQPQRLDWSRHRTQDFRSIAVEEIEALAQIYLSPERTARFRIVPIPPETAQALP